MNDTITGILVKYVLDNIKPIFAAIKKAIHCIYWFFFNRGWKRTLFPKKYREEVGNKSVKSMLDRKKFDDFIKDKKNEYPHKL